MESRFNLWKLQPEAFKAMMGLEKYLNSTGLKPVHKDLIKIRASQINGCAYCINMHTRDARKAGETEQRIYLLNAWREVDLFTEEEKALLALTEEMTLISQHHVSDETYNNAKKFFDDTYLAQVMMAIVVINGWNRVAIATRTQPD